MNELMVIKNILLMLCVSTLLGFILWLTDVVLGISLQIVEKPLLALIIIILIMKIYNEFD